MAYQGYDPFDDVGSEDSSGLASHTILRAAYDLDENRFELMVSGITSQDAFEGIKLFALEGGIPTELLANLSVADATYENVGDVTLDAVVYNNVAVYIWDVTNPFTETATFSVEFQQFEGEQTGTPFEGIVQWPHLDLGNFGTQKNLIGLDVVSDAPEGLTVSVGYDQRNLDARTAPYEIEADTLPGQLIPMPVGGPSFDLKLVFNGSQRWELQAANLYVQDNRTGS
jgi:hypothetical protein